MFRVNKSLSTSLNRWKSKLKVINSKKVVLFLLLFFISLFLVITFYHLKVKTSHQPNLVTHQVSSSKKINSRQTLWSNQFSEPSWNESWGILERDSWGLGNLEVISDPTQAFEQILRVHYPSNSASPTVAKEGNPVGGGQFYADLNLPPQDALVLSYYVRFSENFNFVKGGKLPGLYGGEGNNGGDIPNGTDGFSTRYMWRRNGDGEIYAYLPISQVYGTSIGRGNWQFRPGRWYYLQQEVILNDPNQANGSIRVWVNEKQKVNAEGLVFRTINQLKIDGILFSSFFGGGDKSWATPEAVYADFAQFSVSSAPSS